MNRFKCPACGGNQYTACSTAERCIYCGNNEFQKMETLEPEESEGWNEADHFQHTYGTGDFGRQKNSDEKSGFYTRKEEL